MLKLHHLLFSIISLFHLCQVCSMMISHLEIIQLILPAELLGHQSSIVVVVHLSFTVVLHWHQGSFVIVVVVMRVVVSIVHFWLSTFTSKVTFLVTIKATKFAFVVPYLAITSIAPNVSASS